MKKVILVLCCLVIPKLGFSNTYIIDINGMVCDFCAQGISKTLTKKLRTISNVSVDLNEKQVRFQSEKSVDHKKIEKLIKNAGYDVTKIQVIEEVKKEEKLDTQQPESEETKKEEKPVTQQRESDEIKNAQ